MMDDVGCTRACNKVMMVAWQLEKTPTWSSKIFSLVPLPVAKQPSLYVTMRHLNARYEYVGENVVLTTA